MKLTTLIPILRAEVFTAGGECAVTGCYSSDLLSDVLAHAQPGVLWITVQTHRNVVAVATTKDIPAVLFTGGRKPDAAVIAEANQEGLALLSTPLSTFEAAGKIYESNRT